jgi:hypothetical protein
MFIERIGWIDPWRLSVWCYQKRKDLPMVLIGEAGEHPDFQSWGALRLAVGKARQIAEPKGFDLLHAAIEQLSPGEYQPWSKDEDQGIIVHIGIVGNPACSLFAGTESVSLIPGQIVAFGTRLLRSAVNMGETPRYDLVMRFAARGQA